MKLSLGRLSLATACAAFQFPGQTSMAQTQAGEQVEEIIVTGSRIARRDYVSPSPIATLVSEDLLASGEVNLENALIQATQFGLGEGQQTNEFGGGGRASVNLRGLGDHRNLVLLDGRRLPNSSHRAVTDINLIPHIILENVEVISGGASAVYGSDAISGVVNFRTKQGFEGTQANVQFGASAEGDAENIDASFMFGDGFADGRGSFLAAINYTDRAELVGAERDYYAGTGISGFLTPGRTLNVIGGGAPSQAVVDAIFLQYGVAPGTVNARSQVGFNDDGTLFAVTGGANLIDPTGRLFVLPNGSVSETIQDDRTIIQPMERTTVYSKLDFDVSDGATLYASALFSNSNVVTSIGYPLGVGQPGIPVVPVTNPFISAGFQAWLAGRPNPHVPTLFFKRFTETGRRVYDTDYESHQVVVGLRGELGGGYSWDVYYANGGTDVTEDHPNSVLGSRVQELLNAPDGGASICSGGYNIFGRANNSQECLDYISVGATNLYDLSQDILEGTFQGTLFSMPAGDVQFALTGTYREDSFARTADPLFSSGAIYAATPIQSQPEQSIDVTELAGEVLVPLVDNLNLGLGYRFSDYSHAGNIDTYKMNLDFQPLNTLLLRASYERAVRAPNFFEAFSPITTSIASIGAPPNAGDPCDVRSSERMDASIATALRDLCVAQGLPDNLYDTFQEDIVSIAGTSSGNVNLDPEAADTFTTGFVFSPEFGGETLQNVNVSVDYYSIEIEDAINSRSGPSILSGCFNRDGSNPTLDPNNVNCQLIAREQVTGGIDDIRSTFINSGGFKTDGVDVAIEGEFHFDAMPGILAVGSSMNFLGSFEIADSDVDPFIDYANTIDITEFPPLSPLPEFKALTTVDYIADRYSAGLRWRRLSSMDNRTSITNPGANDPGPSTYDLFDLIGSFQITDSVLLNGGITNLADEQPEVLPPGNYIAWGQNAVGRAFYLRLSVDF